MEKPLYTDNRRQQQGSKQRGRLEFQGHAPARCPGNGTIASPCPDNFAMKLCYVTYFIASIAQNTKETELVSPAETFSSVLHFINAVFKPWGYPPERFLTLLVLIETLFFRILAMQHHSKILFFSHIRRNLHQMTGERERYSFNWLTIFLLLYKWFPVDLSTCTNVCMKGGEQMVREVDSHWMENLTASPNKKDIVTLHVKGKGLHLYVPKPDGSLKYTCVENSGCKRHQRYFQSSSSKALFKTFIQQYPLRRGMQH